MPPFLFKISAAVKIVSPHPGSTGGTKLSLPLSFCSQGCHFHTGNGRFVHNLPCLKACALKSYSESGFELRILYLISFLASESTTQFHNGKAYSSPHSPRHRLPPHPCHLIWLHLSARLLVRSSSHLAHTYGSSKSLTRDKTDDMFQ